MLLVSPQAIFSKALQSLTWIKRSRVLSQFKMLTVVLQAWALLLSASLVPKAILVTEEEVLEEEEVLPPVVVADPAPMAKNTIRDAVIILELT